MLVPKQDDLFDEFKIQRHASVSLVRQSYALMTYTLTLLKQSRQRIEESKQATRKVDDALSRGWGGD